MKTDRSHLPARDGPSGKPALPHIEAPPTIGPDDGMPPAPAGTSLPQFRDHIAALVEKYGGKIELIEDDPTTEGLTILSPTQQYCSQTIYPLRLVASFANGKVTLDFAKAKGIEEAANDLPTLRRVDTVLSLCMSFAELYDPKGSLEDLTARCGAAIDGVGTALEAWRRLGSCRLKENLAPCRDWHRNSATIEKFITGFNFKSNWRVQPAGFIYTADRSDNETITFTIEEEKPLFKALFKKPSKLTLSVTGSPPSNARLAFSINNQPVSLNDNVNLLPHNDAALFVRAFMMTLSQLNSSKI